MKPWTKLATTTTPDGTWLELREHDGEYVIRADTYDLMTSRNHGSEQAMATLALPDPRPGARVLIGGLGMGFTLRAVLDLVPADGSVVVSELVPDVVEWNRGVLAALAGHPLDDPRTELAVEDVAATIGRADGEYDAILLDVDNGPSAFTQRRNARLYSPVGLAEIRRALRPGGALAVWSAERDRPFEESLAVAGFAPEFHKATSHGARHIVFVGRKRG